MEWIIWLAVIIMVGSTVTNIRTKSKITRALEGKPQQTLDKMIESPKPAHSLMRTWIVATQEGSIAAGWRWKCHCGVWGVASDTKNIYNPENSTVKRSIGTEKSAIDCFKEHASQYTEVNTDYYKDKFEQEQADFAEYRRLCYCKESNHDLFKWKDI